MKLLQLFNAPIGQYTTFAPRKKHFIPIALAAASVASSIYGAAKGASANRAAQEEAEGQKRREDALLNRRRNENFLDTAAGQNLVRQAREFSREDWKRESGRAAVAGGTDAASAIAKEKGNKMVGDAIANIAAQDSLRKDKIDDLQMESDRRYSQQKQNYEIARGQNIAAAAQGLSNGLAQAASAIYASQNSIAGGNNGGQQKPAAPKINANVMKKNLKLKPFHVTPSARWANAGYKIG